jgi:lysophospholipase L1-like esterase
MKKAMIIASIVLNVLLITALYYVACVKTDFSKRMMAKIKHEAYVPERVDQDCVNSWNNCIEKLDMEADVVFFGDSETAGGDFQKAFPDVKSINLGYIGEDVKGMLRRVDAIKAVKPKKVFLMAGINGLQQQSLSDFEYWYAALVDSIRSAVPDAELYIESILPVTSYSDYCDNEKIREANAILQRLAEERDIQYIDVYSAFAQDGALPETMSYDGLHLTEEAYDLWYEAIRKSIDDKE